VTLGRLFNLKHGLIAADDRLPSHMMEPVRKDRKEGWAIAPKELKERVKTYYDMMDRDDEGFSNQTNSAELGIGTHMA